MIILDIETTSLDRYNGGIIELAAMELERPENYYETLIRAPEGAAIAEEALQVNGQTEEEIFDENRIELAVAISQFNDWKSRVGEQMIGGLNVAYFDIPYLETQRRKHAPYTPLLLGYISFDINAAYMAHMITNGIQLETRNIIGTRSIGLYNPEIASYAGIPDEESPHKAIRGVRHEAECISRLLHGKNLLPEFAEYPVPEHFL